MPTQKLAVAVIHGMGSQGLNRPQRPDEIAFSGDLRKRIRAEMGRAVFDRDVAWREIFWADVLQKPEKEFLTRCGSTISRGWIRNFVIHNLGDAAGYRYVRGDDNHTAYADIHARVRTVVRELEALVDPCAPLVVLAHSLGGHIMSNYIYDIDKKRRHAPADMEPTDFQNLETMAGFVTFGCNIPIFTFAYDKDDIHPIAFPGRKIPEPARLKPWWWNYYDRDDVLGYPLRKIGPHYQALATAGDLKDKRINSGNILESWNPLSHNAYWRDDDLYRPVAKFLKNVMSKGGAL